MARVLFNPRPARDARSRRHALGGTATAAPAGLMRWLAPAALAAALGATALAAPSPARADDNLVRVLVDVADVIFRSGSPYYRDDRGRYERLVVVRGPYGPQYYRHLTRDHDRRGDRHVKCNRHGKCKVKYTYYDPRYDRDRRFGHREHDRDWGRDRDWDDRDWDDDRDDRYRRWYGRHDDGRVRYRVIRAGNDD